MKIFDKVQEKYKNNIYMRSGFADFEQIILRFNNNYGAKFSKHKVSDGNEMAVIYFENDEWHEVYNTGINDDMLLHLTEEEVFKTIEEIKCLSDE